MSALTRFKNLRPKEQKAFLSRVRAGWVDAPPQFEEMVAWYDAHTFDESTLPGGMTRREWEYAQSIRRAGLVDQKPQSARNQPRKWRPPYSRDAA